jgi:hypothetical protein
MTSDAGVPTITGAVRVLGHPMLAGWARAGDYGGVVTVALGLNANKNIRVGELSAVTFLLQDGSPQVHAVGLKISDSPR